MAHTKAGGSTKLGRDSAGQRLGVKRFGGEIVSRGSIIVRQRGTRMVAGEGATVSRDQTIYASIGGEVSYSVKQIQKFTGQKIRQTVVSVKNA